MMQNDETSQEITNILRQNKLADLKRFLQQRQCLNFTNTAFVYLFHLVQSAGILVSSYAAGTNDSRYVWVGITLNVFATLIHSYEKTNHSILGKLMVDVNRIRDGTYVDEGVMIDIKDDKPLQSQTLQSHTSQSHTSQSHTSQASQSNTPQIKNLENPNYGTIKEFSV
jgi:hypothetical protein